MTSWISYGRTFFFLCVQVVSVASSTNLHAQSAETLDVIGRATAVSKSAEVVESWSVDPLMTESQENAIWAVLNQPCPFQWGDGVTVNDLQRDLVTRIPTIIDIRSLEQIGISLTHRLLPRGVSPRRVHDNNLLTAESDPFGELREETSSANGSLRHDAATMGSKSTSHSLTASATPWWRRGRLARGSVGSRSIPTTGARLLLLLASEDLTLNIQGGQLILTTTEAAEQRLSLRVYDVTPLIDQRSATTTQDSNSFGYSLQGNFRSLIHVLETAVDPETWETLGGPSSIVPFQCRQRHWLVISTTISTQWKIQALLNCVNQ